MAILIVYVARSNSFIERSTHSRDSIHSGLGTGEMNSILRYREFFYLATHSIDLVV